jgi:hypothetical protein
MKKILIKALVLTFLCYLTPTTFASYASSQGKKDSNYHHDESKNPGGPNRCQSDMDCDGNRTCSSSNWCQGEARPTSSSQSVQASGVSNSTSFNLEKEVERLKKENAGTIPSFVNQKENPTCYKCTVDRKVVGWEGPNSPIWTPLAICECLDKEGKVFKNEIEEPLQW